MWRRDGKLFKESIPISLQNIRNLQSSKPPYAVSKYTLIYKILLIFDTSMTGTSFSFFFIFWNSPKVDSRVVVSSNFEKRCFVH